MKKSFTIAASVIVSLGLCWYIGQQTHKENSYEVHNTDESIEIEDSSGEDIASQSDFWDNISFEGDKETSDNPWNMTAGKFEMEGEGDCILLTPNTAVQIDNLSNSSSEFSFVYQIHPWVKTASDGAGLLLWVLNEKGSILYEEEINIDKNDDWKEYRLNLGQYEGVDSVKIFCNNGVNEDDSGDWVILKFRV